MKIARLIPLLLVLPGAASANRYAFVVNEGDETVSAVNVDTASVAATIPVGQMPRAVAVTPDGRYVYVAAEYDNTIDVIAVPSFAVVGHVAVDSGPRAIAVDPAGANVYVAHEYSAVIDVFPAGVANPAVATQIDQGELGALSMAVDKDVNQIYIGFQDGTVATLDLASQSVVNPVPTGAVAHSIAPYGAFPPGRAVVVAQTGPAVVARVPSGSLLTLTSANVNQAVATRYSPWNLIEIYLVRFDTGELAEWGAGVVWPTGGMSPSGIAYSDDEDPNANDQAFIVTNKASGTVGIIKVDTANPAVVVPVGSQPDAVAAGPVMRSLFLLNPRSLSFRYAAFLLPTFQVIRISNGGNDSLVVGKLAVTGADAKQFVVSKNGCADRAVAPGGTCDLTIAFTAVKKDGTATPKFSATLEIPSNDPAAKLTKVPMTGVSAK